MESIRLNDRMIGGKTVVRYLMKQKGGNVLGQTSPGSAMWMLTNDRRKQPRMSGEFEEYPLTADGVYFFDGEIDGGTETEKGGDCGLRRSGEEGGERNRPHPSAQALTPSPEGKAFGEKRGAPEGKAEGDGNPAERAKRRKRVKDVVCE